MIPLRTDGMDGYLETHFIRGNDNTLQFFIGLKGQTCFIRFIIKGFKGHHRSRAQCPVDVAFKETHPYPVVFQGIFFS